MDRKRIESEITQLSHHLDARTICSSPNARDVDKCLDLLNEVDAYLTHSVFGNDRSADLEPSIVVLGTTGAGKSTIVSFLVGEGRTVVRHESRYARALIADPPLPDVNIRSGEVSVSLLPTVTHATMGGEVVAVWDMPGYRDTRGPFVELVVHFIFKWMLKVDKPVKFILVTPPLHERPQTVMLQNMINGSLIRKDNAIIVYTKCGRDFDPESTSDLNIEENKREIRSFALPAPAQSDEDDHDYSLQYCARKDEMLKTLSGLHSYKVEYGEKLPDAAKLLLEALTKTCVQFVQEELSKCFLCKFKWDLLKGSFEEITDMLETLKCTEDITLKTMVDILARIAPSDYDYAPEFYCAKRRLSIVETMNGGETRRHLYDWLNEECRRLLEKTKEKLLDLRNAVKTYSLTLKTDDTLVISAFQLRLSDELERIEKFVRKREVAIDSVEAIPNVISRSNSQCDYRGPRITRR
ncbi:hypothetical protein L916_20032 [Phytophthora nicotianae]|uniref:Uncharacterized protein n=1 Tax=Phytophthora nicotianae TaxID=4792 RepID=W2HYQ3_PHYNI|nr:hypothetical protein L916_20032 [Phytophthora nicotianae]